MATSHRRRGCNPFAFHRWPVTIIATVIYLAILIPLLVIDLVVPSAPETAPEGLDLGEAWADLQSLTEGFRPYNSHQNDKIHSWILKRVNEIVSENKDKERIAKAFDRTQTLRFPDVFIFDDVQSNLSFSGDSVTGGTSNGVYFEGTNILVYIRGTDDDQANWWEEPHGRPSGRGGVLVNAHYDSVSTGYGATDDGVGVVTCLQLVKYFTTPDHQPQKGLVVMFNNGEEDYLNGARIYSQHPISQFPHTFLNVEGAGAGGRATLFRGSDTEVIRFYERVKHPFGSVLSQDGFKMGLIRSQTDYVVLEGNLGLRGLDVAFMRPRARYHTDQDDARHTNLDSIWHMLSASVVTTEGLVSDTSDQFEGRTEGQGKVSSGTGTEAVWFDLFGATFVVFRLHVLFALQVTLLVVSPLVLFGTSIALSNSDRMYLFSFSATPEYGEEKVSIRGLRGLFRFPFIFSCATAVTVGLAFLLAKVNPLIIHSSQYAVWSMFISIWFFFAWFLSRVANFVRPSALHRAYTLTWMFTLMWALLVVATVYENRDGIAGGYFIFFYTLGVFLATWVSYLEMFALPRKTEYATEAAGYSRRGSSSRLLTPSADEIGSTAAHRDEEPTESTSLLRGARTTFANYTRVENEGDDDDEEQTDGTSDTGHDRRVYGYEQPWSASLPKWTWILQLLFIAPITLILVGQIALLDVAGVYQTGQDGSPMLTVYLQIAIFTTLLLTPLMPFIHRYTHHVPTFLLFVFIATLIYNLVAFPFSEADRIKLYFQQEVDLDTSKNLVSLTGIPPYVRDVIGSLPSAANQDPECHWIADRYRCSWEGPEPRVAKTKATWSSSSSSSSSSLAADKITTENIVDNTGPLDSESSLPPKMKDWVSYNVTRLNDTDKGKARARFHVSGLNTRACVLRFNKPISNFIVAGSATDPRFPVTSNRDGLREIRLWSRTWGNTWTVDVDWEDNDNGHAGDNDGNGEDDKGDGDLSGRVVCLWSDRNTKGVIPALDEALQYLPAWVAITKYSDGLVEASKAFKV